MNLQGMESNTLTAVRDWIGLKHQSGTCTSIQHTFVSVNQYNVLEFTTLGLSAVMSAFEEAALIYTWTNGCMGKRNMNNCKQALAFIQGTGLEIALSIYGLDYDADSLRQNFFRIFHVKTHKENS